MKIASFVCLGQIICCLQFQASGAGVVLQRATATFSQTMSADFSVARCIDGVVNDNLGWAIQGAISNQTAAFQTVQDSGFAGGSLLTFSLVQNGNWWGWTETLGRFRISVTTDDRSTFCDGLPTGGDVTANWTVLQPISYTSLNGASLARQPDNSILAGGTAPLIDTYTITTATTLTGITGIRLEVMQDPSLPFNGPGREPPNGNFILSEFQVSIAPEPGCVPPPSNLVSWWRGEDSTADAVGGNNGTIAGTGTVTYGPGVVGRAFVFDGTHRDRIDLGNPVNLQLQDFTLEAWVKRSSPTETAFDILGADGSVCGDGACIIGWGRGGYILAVANDGRLILSRTDIDGVISAPLITDLNWHHLAVTKAGSNAVFYVDGVAQATPAYVPHEPYTFDDATCSCNAAIAIGSRGDARGGTFYGMIDEPAVFNRALSASEIQSIYAADSAGMCPPPACVPAPAGMVSWWRGEGSALDSWDHNKGELHGASFAPGEVGQAFSFNGTSDYVHIPVAGNLPAASNLNVGVGPGLTLDAWVNPSDTGNGHPVIEWSQLVGGAPYGVHLWIGHPSRPAGYFYANIADTDGNWHVIDSPSGLIQPNVFQHVAVTYNKSTGLARLFLNGTIVSETNLGIFTPQTSYELYFGERPPGDINSRFYVGLIDEIDVFSRALEPAEIQAIYNAGSAGKCVVNRPPVANDFREQTFMRQPVTIHDVTFIAASSDPDEDTLTLDSVSASSVNGGTVVLNAGIVTYTPPIGLIGSDSFGYTISDGNGGTASASVWVEVNPSPFAAHMLPPAFVDGGFQLNFSGYPGATYTLQRAEALSGPWTDLGSVTVDPSGNGTLLDSNPPQGNAFYRAVYH